MLAGESLSRTLSNGRNPNDSSYAVLLGDLGNLLGGDDGLHEELVALELTQLLLVGDDVPREHHACLVAVEDLPFTLRIAAYDGQTVGIGVGGNHEVGIQARTEFHAKSHGLSILGVGADNGGEVTVDDHLLGHDMNVLEAP